MLKRTTLEFEAPPSSLNWRNGALVDWVKGGSLYHLNGDFQSGKRIYSYHFDAAIQSDDEVYAIIYERLGTKGLVLKNGEIVREINRSFYHADVYEYPISFLKSKESHLLIHCPQEYNQIEIEDIETGTRVTSISNRTPDDCFHSRFKINASNTFLINAGWVWHPVGILEIYDIQKGIANNTVLDNPKNIIPINSEVCSAEFLNEDLVIISSSNEESFDNELSDENNLHPNQIGLFSIARNKFVKKVNVSFKLGTQIPIDENYTIDLYEHPKLIDLNSGEIKSRFEDINSGKQDSAIIHHIEKIPPIAFDKRNKKIAIANGSRIELLEFLSYQ